MEVNHWQSELEEVGCRDTIVVEHDAGFWKFESGRRATLAEMIRMVENGTWIQGYRIGDSRWLLTQMLTKLDALTSEMAWSILRNWKKLKLTKIAGEWHLHVGEPDDWDDLGVVSITHRHEHYQVDSNKKRVALIDMAHMVLNKRVWLEIRDQGGEDITHEALIKMLGAVPVSPSVQPRLFKVFWWLIHNHQNLEFVDVEGKKDG